MVKLCHLKTHIRPIFPPTRRIDARRTCIHLPLESFLNNMIWFFVLTSVSIALVGVMLLATPEKMLFLMPEADKHRLMGSGYYRVAARVGGALMIFMCAPLNLIFGFLFLAS